MTDVTHDPFESPSERLLGADCTPEELREQVYPSALRAAEAAEVRERRLRAGLAAEGPAVGLALSGGGIRSATFCLGLFQALARQGLIRKIDFLSTVSGGGYFGSFLGAAFARHGATPDGIEAALRDNRSWAVHWLRKNGRFLSPNGAGDNWLSAAVALRNWLALHTVLLTLGFALLGFGVLVRADLCTLPPTREAWHAVEQFFWLHPVGRIWTSPWTLLIAVPFLALMAPAGLLYWLTQFKFALAVMRRVYGWFRPVARAMALEEFAAGAQNVLTRGFMLGLVPVVLCAAFAVIDSLGQTIYLYWSLHEFRFPSLWTVLTGTAAALFGFGAKFALVAERLLASTRLRLPLDLLALVAACAWSLLIVLALSVAAFGLAWGWAPVWDGIRFRPMSNTWPLLIAVSSCLLASWFFSRSFGFVNLSSMQQVYAARLARAYLGASNPRRRRHANHSMTDLIPGDDLPLDDYLPHRHGGPLHLINLTVNETLSGKTHIERRDRKGLAMAVGPCGLSVGQQGHGLWVPEPRRSSRLARLAALWERRHRAILPISPAGPCHPFHVFAPPERGRARRVECLALGRWSAISGAAFTTGAGANTHLGLSLLLGLANVRLGYWWDSGIMPGERQAGLRAPNVVELTSRIFGWALPVQTCLMNEFFARFHGPARRYWYLSDGGHFENTGCYELIRRRVPFIICSDAGQDPAYRFDDFANLVRKVRTDFGAEIQVARRAGERPRDDPGSLFPLPSLEQLVHPALLDTIGTPEDFTPLDASDTAGNAAGGSRTFARRHALLARIHYLDDHSFSWLLLVKPSLMGDEATDVVQYQATHPLFPQEPTTDQYFDEAQWESYRKLGEHVGAELFTPPPASAAGDAGADWSPSEFVPPRLPDIAAARESPPRVTSSGDAALSVSLN